MNARRWIAASLTACLMAGATAGAAEAAPLTRAAAVKAATKRANKIAKGTATLAPGKASKPKCVRKSASRFRCTTTIKGQALCDGSAEDCVEPAPFEAPYVITVSRPKLKLVVTAVLA